MIKIKDKKCFLHGIATSLLLAMLHHLDTDRERRKIEGKKNKNSRERKVQNSHRLGINRTKKLSGLRIEAEVGIILH